MIAEHDVFDFLVRVDPVADETPPVPGSARRRSIRDLAERARSDRHAWRGHRLALLRVAAALAVVALGFAVMSRVSNDRSAAATVRRALERHEGASSYEALMVTTVPGDGTTSYTVRVSGHDQAIDIDFESIDGQVEHSSVVLLGDVAYRSLGGATVVEPRGAEVGVQPSYGALSSGLIDALGDADVAEDGTEIVGGVVATRYDVELSERSVAAFSVEELGLSPEDLVRLVVWIADEQLRQVELVYADGVAFVGTFSDVDGEIAITAPTDD